MDTIPRYRIHPAIGIARLGNSPDEFYIAPEQPAALPIDCDKNGNTSLAEDGLTEIPITQFRDTQGRIKRQAARFQIFVYDDAHPEGRALKIGDKISGGGNRGTLQNILWQVYVANKKAVWYEFKGLAGETGYQPDHPRRNADITGDDARQQLIIDPGPHILDLDKKRRAEFSRDGNPSYATVFPPKGLWPQDIDSLGTALTDDQGRLLVLGGYGHSGSYKSGIGQPRIDNYANTDGWFDDTSDGSIMARLVMFSEEVQQLRYIDVEYPAWVISGYPRFVPQMLDMVTLEDVVEDLSVTEFATRPDLYGIAGTFKDPAPVNPLDPGALSFWRAGRLEWNPDYQPWFWRDIWPILFRPNEFNWVSSILLQSNMPHDQSRRGTFDPMRLCEPPVVVPGALIRRRQIALATHASGVQATEALEPQILRWQREQGSSPAALDALITGLATSFAAFVQAVLPLPETTTVPMRYLEEWRAIFAASIENPSPAYSKAHQRLEDQVQALLFPPAAGRAPLKAERRAPSAPKTLDPDERLIDAAHRVIREFCSGALLTAAFEQARLASTTDPYAPMRQFLYGALRRPGEENLFQVEADPTTRNYHLPLMPLLAGDNPIYNETPSKFLRLTETQLYLLRQWADGKFINEVLAGFVPRSAIDPLQPYPRGPVVTGAQLDRGVLSNMLGGAFFPGAEVCWVIRNPGIWYTPYRLKADANTSSFQETAAEQSKLKINPLDYNGYINTPLSQDSNYATGLQPGDLTKFSALPWQADYNECSTQTINVTYANWNQLNPDNPLDPVLAREQKTWETLWWPAHRPMQVAESYRTKDDKLAWTEPLFWSRGIPQTHAGDLKMTLAWSELSFVILNPDPKSSGPRFYGVERGGESA